MSTAAIFAQAAIDILEILGVPVVYTPVGGTAITIQALMSSVQQTQPSGMGSETWAQHITFEFKLSDLAGDPAPGDTINDGVNIYTLAAPLENNGMLTKWVVD